MRMKSIVAARGNPYYTMVWLAIAGSFLLFFFLFFVFLLRVQGTGWIPVTLPKAFNFSTLIICFSSVSLIFAKRSFHNEAYNQSYFWLTITLTLAISFTILQVAGWMHLLEAGISLHQTSGAFIYLVTGLHFLHILLGLAGIGWIWLDSYNSRSYVEGFIHSLNPMKMTRLRIVSVFWHFLDLLWIILFALLWLHQKQPIG